MKKSVMAIPVGFLAAIALGCNLSAATPPSVQAPGSNPTDTMTQPVLDTPLPVSTATSTAIRGSTPGPTPTQVPEADCPPYAFDSIGADIASITDPSLFIGKHYNPVDYSAVLDGFSGEMLDDVHALEQFTKDTLSVDFLERLVCRNSGGIAYFEVKDAVILNLGKDQSIARICWAGDQPIKPVLAWGDVDINQAEQVYQGVTGWRFDRMDFVYRIDLERESFAPMPPEGVVCFEVFEGGD
jgi:hypothetical protein